MSEVKPHAIGSALLFLMACAPKEASKAVPDSTVTAAPTGPARVSTTEGFSTPESVIWDAEQRVWFVTNVNGSPLARDGNGFISRLTADGTVDSLHFVQAGRGGAKLNGPKGTAIVGDTLWVADIDAVRGFNRKTGAPVANVEFGTRARFLNDLAVGPDGRIYITDTGIEFDAKGVMIHPGPDRIFALKGRKVTVAAEGAWLARPNGLTWDQANNRFIVVPFGGTALLGWKPGEKKADTIGTGPGSQDGVEVMGGEVLVTSWADSTVFAVEAGGVRKIATGVNSPADIGVDPARGLVAIPLFLENRVEFWRLK
jgi:sugar lactone lactonase YvrE